MNVLLINTDLLRYDSVSHKGLRSVHTTNIDRLASQSVVYEDAFTHAAYAPQSIISP